MKKNLLVIACLLLLSLSLFGCSKSNGHVIDRETGEILQKHSKMEDISYSDEYVFGQYEQDNDLSNGKEDIKWYVLEKAEDKILLMSKYALEPKYYNETKAYVTWEDCTLRTWLNNDFYNEAFNREEQKCIELTTVVADDNPDFSKNPGVNTQDKVFLLSKKECLKFVKNSNIISDICHGTPYCLALKKSHSSGAWDGSDRCWWWLRVSGEPKQKPYYVGTDGNIDSSCDVDVTLMGVRPVIWLNLD